MAISLATRYERKQSRKDTSAVVTETDACFQTPKSSSACLAGMKVQVLAIGRCFSVGDHTEEFKSTAL